MKVLLVFGLLFLYYCCDDTTAQSEITDIQALLRAKAVLSRYPLVDGHNDLAFKYRVRVENRVDEFDLRQDRTNVLGGGHTDIPRLQSGQVGAQFWSAYWTCSVPDTVRTVMEQIDVIHRFVDKYPDVFEYVTTAQGIEDAFSRGKIGSLIGVEGGGSIDSSLSQLRMLYDMGARYLTLTHSCSLPWVGSSTEDDKADPPINTGLTEWGKLVIKEMNRLGMLIDISHVSKQTMLDTLDTSEAPIIFSHSNAWELCHHSRNVQDDVLQATAANGGIVMLTFVTTYVACPPLASISFQANISLVADHIEYIRDKIGIDHVGLGGDYDGAVGVATGLEDVSKYPYLFAALIQRGWEDSDLEKLAGRNIVRVFRSVESVRDDMISRGVTPYDEPIPTTDLDPNDPCRGDWPN